MQGIAKSATPFCVTDSSPDSAVSHRILKLNCDQDTYLLSLFTLRKKNQIFCLIQATRRRPGKFSFRYCFFTEDILASRSRKTTSVNNKMNDSCFSFMLLVLCMLAHCHDLLGCPDGTEFKGKSLINMFFP